MPRGQQLSFKKNEARAKEQKPVVQGWTFHPYLASPPPPCPHPFLLAAKVAPAIAAASSAPRQPTKRAPAWRRPQHRPPPSSSSSAPRCH